MKKVNLPLDSTLKVIQNKNSRKGEFTSLKFKLLSSPIKPLRQIWFKAVQWLKKTRMWVHERTKEHDTP